MKNGEEESHVRGFWISGERYTRGYRKRLFGMKNFCFIFF